MTKQSFEIELTKERFILAAIVLLVACWLIG
jgi:hypothetical protein